MLSHHSCISNAFFKLSPNPYSSSSFLIISTILLFSLSSISSIGFPLYIFILLLLIVLSFTPRDASYLSFALLFGKFLSHIFFSPYVFSHHSFISNAFFKLFALLTISSTSFSIFTKSCKTPSISNGPTLSLLNPLLSLPSPSFFILSGNSICHKSILLPISIISLTSSICFSFNPSNSFSKYLLYFACISFKTVAYPVSSLSVLFISGSMPSCLLAQSVIKFSICISSCSVISFSQFTFIVLFTKSITTGLSSSFVGLSGFSE